METEHHRIACGSSTPTPTPSEGEMELRRGPWTMEEDHVLIKYIEDHGDGRWNSLARCSGLKRTGKSCRLRWLNYLRPDVRRGNITPEEQLLILDLHSRFGNRWSKIAQHLPGRTDNEIKNYWRTRVQKHAKHLQCDVNSSKFNDVVRFLWMPRLVERIRAASGSRPPPPADVSSLPAPAFGQARPGHSPETSSSDSVVTQFSSPPSTGSPSADLYAMIGGEINNGDPIQEAEFGSVVQSPGGYSHPGLLDLEQWDMGGNLWNDVWF